MGFHFYEFLRGLTATQTQSRVAGAGQHRELVKRQNDSVLQDEKHYGDRVAMVVHHYECINAPEQYNGKFNVICILPQLKKRICRKSDK